MPVLVQAAGTRRQGQTAVISVGWPSQRDEEACLTFLFPHVGDEDYLCAEFGSPDGAERRLSGAKRTSQAHPPEPLTLWPLMPTAPPPQHGHSGFLLLPFVDRLLLITAALRTGEWRRRNVDVPQAALECRKRRGRRTPPNEWLSSPHHTFESVPTSPIRQARGWP